MAAAVALNCWLAYRLASGVPRDLRRAAGPRALPRRARPVPADPGRSPSPACLGLHRRRVGRRRSGGPALLFLNRSRSGPTTRSSASTCRSTRSGCRSGASSSASGSAIVVLSLIAAAARALPVRRHPAADAGRARPPRRRARTSSVLLGLFVLLKAASYWLDRYDLVVKRRAADHRRLTYTDVNAVLPAKNILFCIAIICALLFFVNVVPPHLARCPALGFGLLVLSAVVDRRHLPGDRPAVPGASPSEPDKEAPYIQRNIDATRDGVRARRRSRSQDYQARRRRPPQASRPTAARSTNVRLHRPGRRVADVRAAAADPRLLLVRRHRSTSTATSIDGDDAARRGRRGPRARPRRACPTASATGPTTTPSTPTATASSPRTATRRRPTASRTSSSATSRRRASSTIDAAADLLRRELAGSTRSSARPRAAPPVELDYPDDASATARRTTPTPARAACRSARCSTSCCSRRSSRRRNILLSDLVNSDSQDPLRPRPARPGREGRAVADRRRRRLPGGRRRPDRVDRRRLHDDRTATRTRSAPRSARRRPTRVSARSRVDRAAAADQINYIRNSVKADGRRLRRHGHALRVGRRPTRC